MENKNFDVFISYSRKDYVDENKKVIPGNIVSQIKAALDENNISYWMDEKGIYNGDEYARLIATYIRRCKIFLFVSTENSNASEWTSDEIATARMYKKKIMPFKYDDSFYNETVILFIAKLDYIDYIVNPDHALTKLIESIRKYLNELEEAKRREEELKQQKLREEEDRRRKQEEEAKKEEIKKEIKIQAEDCQRLIVQQEAIAKQLVNKNIFVGKEAKLCPICNNSNSLNKTFCDKCGWQFPLLYSLDGNDTFICDDAQLSIARANWQGLNSIVELQNENKKLVGIRKEIEEKLRALNKQCRELTECINQKDFDLIKCNATIESMSQQLNESKQIIDLKEEQNREKQSELSRLQDQIESLILKNSIQEKEIEEKTSQLQEQLFINQTLKDDFAQIAKNTIEVVHSNDKKTEKNIEDDHNTVSNQSSTKTFKETKPIKNLEEAFSIIESCCNTSPIHDNYDFKRAKLSLNRLRNALVQKYNLYVSKKAILSCKNMGELKHFIYSNSNKEN